MAYFQILADDRADALDDRIAHRQEHIDYWAGKPGVVKIAGAILDGDRPCGSWLLIEAENEAAARALMAGDPFTTYGIFSGAAKLLAVRPSIGDWLPSA